MNKLLKIGATALINGLSGTEETKTIQEIRKTSTKGITLSERFNLQLKQKKTWIILAGAGYGLLTGDFSFLASSIGG